MTASSQRLAVKEEGPPTTFVGPYPLAARLLPPACSLAALALIVLGLYEFDIPLARFVRSLAHAGSYQLRDPWLARISDLGHQLGKGDSLAAVSVMILLVGYGLGRQNWKSAGWQTLVSHGLAGLFSNVIKHLVGRARPKFMHAGNLELSPLTGSGWDSFPSGHAAASFAVGTVLAMKFPRWRWAFIVLASAIAGSRILRGSHFITDVAVGTVIGVLAGTVVATPWRDWRRSLESGLVKVAPPLAALFVVVWTVGHRPPDRWLAPQLIGTGMALCIAALLAHGLFLWRPAWRWPQLTSSVLRGLIACGIGMFSGSLWVAMSVGLAWLACSLRRESTDDERIAAPVPLWMKEAAFGLAVLLTLYSLSELRGALPML